MNLIEKEQLKSNLHYTATHVSKVNELLSRYQRIHRIPYNSLTAIVATVLILVLFWAVGLTYVIHSVGEKVGTSMVTLEKTLQEDTTVTTNNSVEEEEPIIDLSFITDLFTSEVSYSTSGVFKYAIIVAIFDTILLVGLAIGLTYGSFFLAQYIKVERNKAKVKQLVTTIKEALEALEHSFIPEEYWHVPYLQRMIRFIDQGRADNLQECLDLIDLEIRHKQIMDALLQEEAVDAKLLSESIVHPKHPVMQKRKEEEKDIAPTQYNV